MKDIRVSDIVCATGGRLLFGDPDAAIVSLTTDSRAVSENALFVPIKGERMDGHDFLPDAVKNGAKAVFSEKESVPGLYNADGSSAIGADTPHDPALSVILVSDTTAALQAVGKLARTKVRIPAIGVTGSVGKTTTREMISYALSAAKKVYKTGKNYNNKIGVPLTLSEMTDESDIAVLELGLNVPGELGTISALTDLDAAIITNIGVAHIEYYGTKDGIAREKFTVTRGFFDDSGKQHRLFLNADDPYLMKYRDLAHCEVITYGAENPADYQAKEVRTDPEGRSAFTLYKHGEAVQEVVLNVLGSHNVLNAAGALSVADAFSVPLSLAAESLGRFTGFKGRLERFVKDGILFIDDTYNASPASMKAGLSVLSGMERPGRRIAVLGDMFELGENAPAYHEEVGAFAAALPIEELFLLGENAAYIAEGYRKAGGQGLVVRFTDRERLYAALREEIRPGDTLYFKASHSMMLSLVTERFRHG